MKKTALFIFFLMALFGASFAAGNWQRKSRLVSNRSSEGTFLDNRFIPTRYPTVNRPFVIFVVGYNNGAAVEKTLHSIFSQHYAHFRLIYVDDGSSDGSFSLAQDLIHSYQHVAPVTVLRNEERFGEMANLYAVIQSCQDEEIVVVLGGEDWLAHEWVLSRLNEYYADPDLWLTYGQYREFPTYREGACRPIKRSEGRGFRDHPFVASHLKTFYAGLFKKIPESDFSLQGHFLTAGADLATMIPLLEMGVKHFQFIPETLYIANRQNPTREEREQIVRSERFVRSLPPYAPIDSFLERLGTHE